MITNHSVSCISWTGFFFPLVSIFVYRGKYTPAWIYSIWILAMWMSYEEKYGYYPSTSLPPFHIFFFITIRDMSTEYFVWAHFIFFYFFFFTQLIILTLWCTTTIDQLSKNDVQLIGFVCVSSLAVNIYELRALFTPYHQQ